jgi:1-deoxy-D-xylulose-5-phosphate reductoisomerase
MRLPIQYALAFPERISGPARKMDWQRPGAWEFFAPEPARYPALGLGMKVAERGGTAGAALNAANEVAVARFLAGSLRFTEIAPLCEEVLERHEYEPAPSLETLQETDRRARQEADIWIRCRSSSSS